MKQAIFMVVVMGLVVVGCQGPEGGGRPRRAPAEWWKTFDGQEEGTGEFQLVHGQGKVLKVLPETRVVTVRTAEGFMGMGVKEEVAWWDKGTVVFKGGKRAGGAALQAGDVIEYGGTRAHGETYLRRVVVK